MIAQLSELCKEYKQKDNCFYIFFKDLIIQSKISPDGVSSDILNSIDKRDIIIFPVSDRVINQCQIDTKRKIKFPFQNIFIDYVFCDKLEDYYILVDGILIRKFKNKDNAECIFISASTTIYSGSISKHRLCNCILHEECIMEKENKIGWNYMGSSNNQGLPISQQEKISIYLQKKVIEIIKKLLTSIQKKEYTTYNKWTPSGIINKEIVYSREVITHKRHFWDGGRFKIPLMSKDELLNKGYEIDELVFRNGELKRDVPYRWINNFVVGSIKKETNRYIEILKGRTLKKENELGKILYQLFPNNFIKKHDRKELKGLELDFFIRELNLAFEYDGEQHFDKALCENVFGSNFEELQKRDRKKTIMCRDKGIRLIRIRYDEKINKNSIKRKIRNYNGSTCN